MTYFVTNISEQGRKAKFPCVKLADEVAYVVTIGKSTASTKAKTTFSPEELERIISLWNEEEILFNSRHKDYFKNDVRQNAIKPQLLQQLPLNPSLYSPPKPFHFPHFLHISLLLSSLTNYSNNGRCRILSDIGHFVCCYPQSPGVELHATLTCGK